ncbi:MAG TPA: short-chain fatty acyl-CoA regulator family protein [Sphingobium sp.]|nr:short-chain fatty acyl-CoA regulator family protein [Sphingobium sp.]
MARGTRLFAGQKVRQLRLDARMDQAAMARLLGISVSYLSQLENDDRPLTARVKAALASAFPLDWSAFDERQEEQLLGAFNWALADPGLGSPPPDPERTERLHLHYPDFAARHVELHHALRQTQDRLAMLEEAIAGEAAPAVRAPWESVRDWFHEAGNYIHELDVAAEDLHRDIALTGADNEARLVHALAARHGCKTRLDEGDATTMRAFEAGQLTINAALPPPGRSFQLANQLMQFELGATMARIVTDARLGDPIADQLLLLGLANYAAGALLMPYSAFRQRARELRHDIDPLARTFGVSFEQACHRLSTLQRPGLRGIPFFFCRVDMAGNITKRHSATRMQFARFGGACPLWGVHEAVAIPDRIVVQLAEMPDGVRYVSMARGLVKPSGRYARAPRRYAVALGCESEHAANFVYADGLRLADEAAATPIGMSCRLCPRASCDQRAFPPLDRPIHIERDRRGIVPYGIG